MVNKQNELQLFLNANGIPYELNVSLKGKTWIGFGGVALFWVKPLSRDHLIRIVRFLNGEKILFEIVGATSNCLFPEKERFDCIISTTAVRGLEFDERNGSILCICGEPLTSLVKNGVAKGAGGLAGLVGIPGSVGGAVVNNAGAFGDLIGRVVNKVEALFPDGTIQWLSSDELKFCHRSSIFKRKELHAVLLSVELKWLPVDARMEENKMQHSINERFRTQEHKLKNLGSVFSNPKGLYKEIAKTHPVYGMLFRCIGFVGYRVKHFFPQFPAVKILNQFTGLFFLKKFPRPVISEYGLNCFVRCEGATEEDFFDYINWIKKLTQNRAELEVEVKKGV